VSFLWGNTANTPPEPKKFANISNDQINSNQQAVPVKYLAGRNYVAGDYISPAYNPRAVPIRTQTGKSESSTTGYKYFADFALLFCCGGRRPVDAVYKVIVDSDIRWDGNVTRGISDREVIQVPDLGTLCLYWGSESQAIDNVLLQARGIATGGINPQDSTTWPPAGQDDSRQHSFGGFFSGNANPYSGHYDVHPAYRGQCYGVFKNWKLGRDRTSVPNIQLELKRGCPWINGAFIAAEDRGINPVAVLYDWLTDTRFGMAIPESFLNKASFNTAYTQLEAITGRISPLVTSQTDFRQIIAELMEYYDGWIRRNGRLIEVGMWQSGDVNSTVHLLDDDLLAEPQLEPQGWGPTVNELTVVYKDRQHHFNDYVQNYRDPNNFRITGGPRPETFSRPWLTDAALAKAYARTSGAALALPFTSGNLTVKREWLTAHAMLPGKLFWFDSGFYGLSFLVRLLEVEHQADNSASAIMTVEWERSKWPSLYVPPPFQGPGGFVLGPRAIWQLRVAEVPYLMEDQRYDTQIITLAVRGNVEVQGYRTWVSFDGGNTYQILPSDSSSGSFASFGRTFGAMGDHGGGMGFYLFGIDLDKVVSQTDAQWKDDNLLCFIENEVLSIGKIISYGYGFFTAYTLRGRFGTVPAPHPADTSIFFLFRANLKLIDNAGFIPGAAIKVKLQPFTADLDYDLNAVTPINYTIVGFNDIPAPVIYPGPMAFTGTLNVSVSAPATGMTVRYTTNGTEVTGTSAEWPRGGGGAYSVVSLTSTRTLRVRFYAVSGRYSPETIATYTKVQQIPGLPPPSQQCGAPSWSFSGTLRHTGGNLTLTATTTGSVIHYSKNGGGTLTYSTPIALACTTTGDTVKFWATLAGLDQSPSVFVNNMLETTYGGGRHDPPRNQQ
jgi:hypothetical protein